MEVLPSEYQTMELLKQEKQLARYASACADYGYVLLKVNPTMMKDECMDVVVTSKGVVFCRFFDQFDDAAQFPAAMEAFVRFVFPAARDILSQKLLGSSLLSDGGRLRFAASFIYVFPNLRRAEVQRQEMADLVRRFAQTNCMFAEELSGLKTEFAAGMERFLATPMVPVSGDGLALGDAHINALLQRIAPEYVIVRVAAVHDDIVKPGANEELLELEEGDVLVERFRLDPEQINLVNKITKGEQLILACAGAGKSVLLMAKCFKAAQMNPDKQFLITCYNDNLRSLYHWYISRAGLRVNNIVCMTFHALCRYLLRKNGLPFGSSDYDGWVSAAIEGLNQGQIKDRFYGIFIDEVQAFHNEWYKFCYHLLENKASDDHLFIICGDKTQDLKKLQKSGKAPWQAGEGYPVYRGKSLRIERNYRSCIEINDYINRYAACAKAYLASISPDAGSDPDLFLCGTSTTHGIGVEYKHLRDFSNAGEANEVLASIRRIHDGYGIPYDEIAVIMYNGSFRVKLPGWKDAQYALERSLIDKLTEEDVPYCNLCAADSELRDRFCETEGVRIIKFQSVLGLDFRAAIICGLKPLGYYECLKKPNWELLQGNEEKYAESVASMNVLIRSLYVACSRAREVLHIIASDIPSESVFVKLLCDSL